MATKTLKIDFDKLARFLGTEVSQDPSIDWVELKRLLHLLWGKATKNPGYVKDEWNDLQSLIQDAEAADRNK